MQKSRIQSNLNIALISTVIVILGFIPPIPLGFIPVPLVLQNLGVMLAGILLGAKKGTIAIILVFLVGIIIPTFSGSLTLAAITSPSSGYAVAWLFVPFFTSLGLQKFPIQNSYSQFFIVWLAGVLFVDFTGALWLAYATQISIYSAILSSLIFIPGDTLKEFIALIIAKRLLKIKPMSNV